MSPPASDAGPSSPGPPPAPATPTAGLARLGFSDPEAAYAALDAWDAHGLSAAVARGADPDLAATSLAALAQAWADTRSGTLLERLGDDARLLERLVAVVGASRALGEFVTRHPEAVDVLDGTTMDVEPRSHAALRASLLEATGTDPTSATVVSTQPRPEATDALRVAYRRELLAIAARDLCGHATFEQSSRELADLAAGTLSAALAIARADLPDDAERCRIAVIALGKCGAGELNYVSDVDVVFVYEPHDGVDDDAARRSAQRLASAMMSICASQTSEGMIWEVDANLRPEGRNGPLVRTLDSYVAYYERWAKTWEFQALLKARPVAGDVALGDAYVDALAPMIWQASTRPDFVRDTRAMRRRVVDHIPAAEADRELKLGAGGLRDIEFAVQLLQLVHGRGDDRIRQAATLPALYALISHGYVGREDGAELAEAYIFLRLIEHRVQLFDLRRTHLMPDSGDDLRRIGRSLEMRADPEKDLVRVWRAHTIEVRRLHQKLFYRPLLDAVAALPGDTLRLGAESAELRLSALGYADPAGALTHLQALTRGVSRRAEIQRHLLPAMLAWFAEAPDPDAGLLAFRQVSDSLGATPWFLRKLRDEGAGAEQLARVLASSRYVADLVVRAPATVAMFGDTADLRPRAHEQVRHEMEVAAARHPDAAEAVRTVRRIRRRELSRVAIADVLGLVEPDEVGRALTSVTLSTLAAALAACSDEHRARHGDLPTRLAVVAMGRTGGHETGYASDADVMFVHDPLPDADPAVAHKAALAIAQQLRDLLRQPADDPALQVDADLRPEGRQGPLVRTLASYAAYYARWSEPWEAQALLRADASVGDPELCASFTELIAALRWPEGGLDEKGSREIRRIKARIESERLPRGADPATHLKLGRGGLADVEWTAQLIQLSHGHAVEGLRTTETVAALEAAAAADLIAADDVRDLIDAWTLATRIRNAVMLMRARPAESLPTDSRDLDGIAHLLGYGDEIERLVDDYRRATRRARGVVERVFWG